MKTVTSIVLTKEKTQNVKTWVGAEIKELFEDADGNFCLSIEGKETKEMVNREICYFMDGEKVNIEEAKRIGVLSHKTYSEDGNKVYNVHFYENR